MTGSGMELGFASVMNAPAHRGGAFEGVMSAAIVWMITFIAALSMNASTTGTIALVLVGMTFGAALGVVVTRVITKRRQRERAKQEAEFRAAQEAEFQRKLAEAKAKGDI